MSERGGGAGRWPITVVLLSFEGPDPYALAGGLGVRVTELSRTLARRGIPTHLVFVGDPQAPPTEHSPDGRLVVHRWCQWLSRYYPGGVYHGEEAKRYDFEESVPPFVVEQLARPAVAEGRIPVVLAEEWQTAETLCRISDGLHAAGLRARAVLLWNANNTTGFERINWGRLGYVAALTTVSRYMKHLMWRQGVNPLVIPNGIPRRALTPADPRAAAELRRSFGRGVVLTKVGRFHPDKRWRMAVETVACLKRRGLETRLVACGGTEPHEGEVLAHAQALGLVTRTAWVREPTLEAYLEVFRREAAADVLSLKPFVSPAVLRLLYRVSDAVLANSGHEPFGLVGLEAMAAGGVAVTGATGEDYAVHLENAVVLDSDDPEEAAWYVGLLRSQPGLAHRLARQGRRTARRFLWDRVVDILLDRVAFLAARQGLDVVGPQAAVAGRAAASAA
jgi:glycosyltransferase involved in cell wall biosynthesis